MAVAKKKAKKKAKGGVKFNPADITEVQASLDAVARRWCAARSDASVSRAEYREFLDEVLSDIQSRFDALDEDEARDG